MGKKTKVLRIKDGELKELPSFNRVEIITEKGVEFTRWKDSMKVSISVQDDFRTLKIFIDDFYH